MKNLFLFTLIIPLFISCGNGNNGKYISESGTIEAVTVVVSSQSAGKVESVYFDEGDAIQKGDTVFVIDYSRNQLILDQAEAARMSAEARLKLMRAGARKEDIAAAKEGLEQANIALAKAERDYKRIEKLYNSGSVPQNQFDDISSAYQLALSRKRAAEENDKKLKELFRPEELMQAEANLLNAEAAVKLAEKSLDDCFVSSPIDGAIVSKYVERGETVMPQSPLFKVANLKKMKLIIYVSENDLGKVNLGQRADVGIDSYPGKVYEGKVIYISPEAEFTPKNIQTKDERTKLVFAVKIEIANPNFELKAGMPADAKVFVEL